MGTSNPLPYPGRADLWPSWADEEPPIQPDENIENDEENNESDDENNETTLTELTPYINTGALSNSHTHFVSYASGGGGSLQKAIGEYVRAHRTPQNATRASRAGRRSAVSLGGFLSDVVRRGISEALNDLTSSQFVGKSVNEAMSAILNALAPSGNTTEDAIARRALATTLEELYNDFALDHGIEELDRMDEPGVKGALRSFVANYIFQRFVYSTEVALHDGAVTPDQAIRAESKARGYIREAVRVDFSDNDISHMNWGSVEVSNMIDDIFDQAHTILEALSS